LVLAFSNLLKKNVGLADIIDNLEDIMRTNRSQYVLGTGDMFTAPPPVNEMVPDFMPTNLVGDVWGGAESARTTGSPHFSSLTKSKIGTGDRPGLDTTNPEAFGFSVGWDDEDEDEKMSGFGGRLY
jgi:hypothetical protein